MGTFLACGGLLLAAARAAGSITSEKERDCWTSLLSTPLEPGEIVWAKIAGSVWSLRGVAMLLLLIWGLGVLLDPPFLVACAIHVWNVPAAGFLRCRAGRAVFAAVPSSLRAMAATLATALFVGGLYLFCCMPVMFAASPRSGEGAMLMFTPCVPFLLVFPGVVYVAGEEIFRGTQQ